MPFTVKQREAVFFITHRFGNGGSQPIMESMAEISTFK
jgi:hypothetical protein